MIILKSNQKGFTLIELLAVIVILAIIALITTPIVLDLITNARLDAAQNKTYGVIDAVRLAYTQNQVKPTPVPADANGKIETTFSGTSTVNLGNNSTTGVDQTQISISGEMPSAGKVVIDVASGKITAVNLQFTGFTCNTSADGTATCTATP